MPHSKENKMIQDSRNVNIAFWFLGLVNNFTFVVFVTAAEDILQGYAGLTLVCTVFPGFVTRLTLAPFIHKVSYFARILVVSLSNMTFCLVTAYAPSLPITLTALCLQAAIGSFGELSFLALTSRFPDSVLGTWSSGTGAAGIVGAGVYVLLRNVLGLSSRGTLTACAPLSLLLILIYEFVLSRSDSYQLLPSDENDQKALGPEAGGEREDLVSQREYFRPLLLRYMLPLAIVYFAEYTINQGVMGTLTEYKNHKEYDVVKMYGSLQFTYQLAVFLARSSIGVLQIHKLWILPMLQLVNLMIVSLCALFVWLPSPVFAFGLIFWEGLLGGLTYVNAFSKLRIETPPHLKEWALAVATVGDAAGISVAAVVSIWLEQAILRYRGSN